jgi:hypothetical protein
MPYKYAIVKDDIHHHADFHTYFLAKLNYDSSGVLLSIDKELKLADMDIIPILTELETMAKAFKSKTEDWQPFEFNVKPLSCLNTYILMKEPVHEDFQ